MKSSSSGTILGNSKTEAGLTPVWGHRTTHGAAVLNLSAMLHLPFALVWRNPFVLMLGYPFFPIGDCGMLITREDRA